MPIDIPAKVRVEVKDRNVFVEGPKGKLDFGPWQRVFYGEWDGQRPKRVLLKAMGE